MIATDTRILAMLETELRDRLERRALYRAFGWKDWYRDNRIEVRLLVSLLRRARRAVQ